MLTPTGGGYSSGAEISQSAFPIPTPDRLGPLTDLLEEDDQTPLDSRENSGRRRTDWSFLPRPKTPGSTTSSSESYVSLSFRARASFASRAPRREYLEGQLGYS